MTTDQVLLLIIAVAEAVIVLITIAAIIIVFRIIKSVKNLPDQLKSKEGKSGIVDDLVKPSILGLILTITGFFLKRRR